MSRELRELAVSIARKAGELAARRRAEGVEVAAEKSSITDVVTAADREVEELVRRLIAEHRPDDAILGEEGGIATGASGLTWVVDPIDGTVNYLYGIPQYAVSIAVVEGDPDPHTWRAIAGAVFAPALGELYAAATGEGATLDGRPIRVADAVPLERALVATGFSYDADIRAEQGALAAGLLPRIRDLRRFGAASLDLAAVACGRVDAYYERMLNPWDQAAGALIVREAGGRVVGRGGGEPDRDLLLAGVPEVVEALAPLVGAE